MTKKSSQKPLKIAVFGYGSLVNLSSLATTIGRVPDATYYVMLDGWNRDWSVKCLNNSPRGRIQIAETGHTPDHVMALNIRQGDDLSVNGIVFDVTADDIASLDERETHYDRIDVTHAVSGDHPFDIVYTYTAKLQDTVLDDHTVIIPESYVNLVEEGFRRLGADAHAHYVQSTRPSMSLITSTTYVVF